MGQLNEEQVANGGAVNGKEAASSLKSFLLSVRFLTSIILFLGYLFQYMLKINMSIAIICMVNNTALNAHSGSNLSFMAYHNQSAVVNECPAAAHNHKPIDGPFEWPKATQGLILSSYFYGYILTQVLGGWLSYRIGGKNVLFYSCVLVSIATIVSPFCARWSYIALIVARFLCGLGHGFFWPAASNIWTNWAPLSERSTLIGFSSSGAWVGNIVALPFGGFLCLSGFDGGWPSIFYIFGAMCLVWCVLFFFLIADTPDQHRLITEAERDYIRRGIKRSSTKLATPWKNFATSKACWAIYFAHFASNTGNYLFLTQMPTYLKDVLKFDLKSNGFISALPYIASAFLNSGMALVCDKLIQRNIIGRTNARRLFSVINFTIPIGAIIGLIFVNCSQSTVAVILLVIGISFTAASWGTVHLVNINEVAGPFSGILFGITNTVGTIPGIVAPYLVGVIAKHGTQKEWQIVFIICVVIYFIGGTMFTILCDGNVQDWAVNAKPGDEMKQELDDGKADHHLDDDNISYLTTQF